MTEEPAVQRGAAEDASDAPLTRTEVDASRRPPSDPSGGQPSDADVREAEPPAQTQSG
jgi:hypothetical protein